MSYRHRHRHRHRHRIWSSVGLSFDIDHLLSLAALLLLTSSGLGGCSSDPAKSTCVVAYSQVTVPHQAHPSATPLLLLPQARLDAAGDGFVLLGTDGARVYWAVLGKDGVASGDEQSVALPPHAAGPWFAVAGVRAPHDHILIATLAPDDGGPGTASIGKRALVIASYAIDGPAAMATVASGTIPSSAEVTMGSGRGGMHAAIAWATPGQTSVTARVLGGDGVAVGSDLDLGDVGDTVPGCLRFSAGKGDLTLGFVDTSAPSEPLFVGSEIADDGSLTNPLRLRLGKPVPDSPGCVALTSSGDGYGVAWHSTGVGSYFGRYNPMRPGFTTVRVLSDVRVAGMVPRVAGLGWLGKSYAILFAGDRSAEVWPIDANGIRLGELPVLPSVAGYIGNVSTQTIGTTVYATYADYPAADDHTGGSRLLVNVTCPL
ncbi:MAG: hypothetical protein ABJA82_18615 [Myxococcales bacterium]